MHYMTCVVQVGLGLVVRPAIITKAIVIEMHSASKLFRCAGGLTYHARYYIIFAELTETM